MTFKAVIRRIHLWAGLLLGVQFLLWMASGAVMTWFDIALVRGETSAFMAPPRELRASTYASPGGVVARTEGATSVELRTFLNMDVYEVRAATGSVLFNAATGERISPISEDLARAAAEQDYLGDGAITVLALLDSPPQEYRGATPVWRADFDDAWNTRLYISQSTGEVVARRNDIWRIYDFFWMLHIMDYVDREDFNNPLVRAVSGAGLVFAFSGLMMLFFQNSRQTLVGDIRSVLRIGRRP